MVDDNPVRTIPCSGLQNLISRMPDEDVCVECHITLLCLTPQALKEAFIVPRGQLDRRESSVAARASPSQSAARSQTSVIAALGLPRR
jgi:hypothetical protein